jgi:hypothetical protein
MNIRSKIFQETKCIPIYIYMYIERMICEGCLFITTDKAKEIFLSFKFIFSSGWAELELFLQQLCRSKHRRS